MSKVLAIEEESISLPIICLYGDETFLQECFVKENVAKFRIILVGERKPEFLDDFPQIYFLTYKDGILLPKLQEKIDYAFLFVNTDAAQKHVVPVMEKLTADNAQVVAVIKVFNLTKRLSFINEYRNLANVKLALLGELMTIKRIEEEGVLAKIIENAIENREITISEDNLTSVFPISITDALTGLSRLLFGNFKNNAIYNIYYQNPQTVSATAHLIGRVEEVKIVVSEFKSTAFSISRDEIKEVVLKRLQMDYEYLEASYQGFEKELAKLFTEKTQEVEVPSVKKEKKKKKKKPKGNVSKAIGFTFLSLFFGTFLFLFVNLLFFGLGLWFLKSAVKGVESNNFKTVVVDSERAQFFLSTIKPTANASFDLLGYVGLEKKAQEGYSLLERVVELSQVAGDTFSKFFTSTPQSSKSLTSTISDFAFLYKEGQRIALETKDKTLTSQLKYTYSKLLSFSEVLPIVLGFGEEKKYLLLFQNDEELRPTGGFIGSIGDLTVKDGKVQNLEIQDVYALDGQLKNHIEPPFVVRRYLQPHLYLRDSNFFLNFQEAASTSAYLYNLESSNRPDAVIAVNLEVLKRVMKVLGPIEIPEYKVTVNADNISDFIQNTIKEGSFPGSTQKKDVLNKVLNKIVSKATTNSNTYIQLLKLVPDLMEEKNILFSFSDSSIQRIFSANSYAGEYLDYRKTDSKKINDFLYINEANIGVNKVNAKVQREIEYRTMVSSGNLTSQATLTLNNSSSTDAYTTYITLVSPKGSSLKQILINGEKQAVTPAVTDFKVYEAKDFVAPQGLELEQYTKNNYTYFAFIAKVAPNKKDVIEISYTNGAVKQFSTLIKYSLLLIKQPGTQPIKLTTTVDYPEEFTPVNTEADSYGKNFLKEENILKTDSLIEVELQKASTQN